MVSTRVRLKRGKAVKRWKKGHSAASKPSSNKHREAVKGALRSEGVFRKGAADSLLTKENVTMHEAAATSDDNDEDTSYSQSTTCFSFLETAHPVFHKVRKFWMSPLESQREVCAILAAVSEVVKANDGKECEMEYFAALLSALESAEDEQSVAAILLLLNIIMPEISDVVLQSRFTEISKLLMDKLTCHEKSSSTALLKSLVSCSTHLLSAQHGAIWSNHSTLHFLHLIINYVTHSRPKVRKATHEGLAHMIQSGLRCNDDVTTHPAAISLAKFCLNQLEQASGSTTTLHILNLLKNTLAHMMPQAIKKICERILKILLLSNTLVRAQCLQTLNGLFSRHTLPQGLSVKLNGRLISALYDYQPKISDVQLVPAWTVVMETAHMRLMRFDQDMCLAHLPKLIQSLMSMLLSPSPSNCDVICNSLKSLIEWCLKDCPNKEIIETCFRSIEVGLKFQYQSVWEHVLQVLGHFYCFLGNKHYSIMKQSLVSLCELRNTAGLHCTDQLDRAFAEAVKSVGPRKILELIPLQLDPDSDLCNEWILLIMRDHVSKAELSYFVEHLLPVAKTLKTKGDKLTNQNGGKAAIFRTLHSQVWDLLPAFCTSPIDVEKSFNSVARLLGEGLKEHPLLRPTICRSLRLLIETTANNSMDTRELSKYAKNYLPLLFNIYTESTSESNSFILDCIQCYASITDPQLLEKFVNEICSRFQNVQQNDVKTQIQLTDLLTVLCDRVDVALLGQLYQLIVTPWIKVEDSTAQKKGYLLLEKLMSCNSPSLERFLQDHVSNIQELLIETTITVKSASKRSRIKCIHHIVHHTLPLDTQFLSRVLPEVILSVKEVKEKTRSLAVSLLVDIGHSYDHKSIGDYFNLIIAGLAGSAHMISATIMSLTRLIYAFHDILPEDILGGLVMVITTQLNSKCKEVVKSSLDFVKVIIGVLDREQLLSYTDSLFEAVFSWNQTFQRHFQFKMRVILERLIKRLGYDIVESLVPKQHKKLITHIRKMVTKQQKKKEHKVTEKESKISKIHKPSYEELLADSDEEVNDDSKSIGRMIKTRGSRWIKDDIDDPINLMDHTALQHILASKPARSKARNEFDTGEDGRLLIDGDEEPVNTENKRKRKRSDNDDELLDNKEGSNKKQEMITIPGSQYRSQRARGDMKKRGKPDPYAYLPLNRQSLNKRKKHKTAGYYGALLRRAHIGSTRGRKQLVRSKHRLKK